MKITATKLFEYARVATTQAGKELQEFIQYVNQNFEQIIRALTGGLTLADNMKGQELTLSLIHNKETKTTVDFAGIVGVLPLKVRTDVNTKEAITSLSYYADSTGKLNFVVQFKTESSTIERDCTFFILKS